jgi:hypothetical protein
MSGAALLNILGGGLVDSVGKIADDLHTSDEERAAAELESKKLDTQMAMGVHATNQAEAQHASVFVAGWRPAIGWVCAGSLAMVYIPKAAVLTGIWTYAAIVAVSQWNGTGMPTLPAFPDLGVADLIALTGTMLGMAWMRSNETMQGKAREEPLSAFKLPNPFKRKAPAEVEAP